MISTWFFGGKLRELIQPWRKINMGQPPFCFERCASLAAFHYTTSFLLYACGRRSGMFVCSMPCPSMCPIVFGGAGSSVQWAPSMSFWRGAEEAERQEPAGEDMGSLVWITSLPASKHTGLLGGRNNPFFFLKKEPARVWVCICQHQQRGASYRTPARLAVCMQICPDRMHQNNYLPELVAEKNTLEPQFGHALRLLAEGMSLHRQ